MESMVPQLSDSKKDAEKSIALPLTPDTDCIPRGGLWRALADLMFPPTCVDCGALIQREGPVALCPACFSKVTFIASPFCPCCGLPLASPAGEDHPCGDCITSPPPFDLARAVGVYDKVLLEAIHRFKYHHHWPSGKALSRLMARHLWPDIELERYDLILPVPLHPKKLRQRGFNQAVFLGRALARQHGLALRVDLIRRKGYTMPQVGLDAKDRHQNVRGAFEVKTPEAVEGKKVILVDDVYTTGSTVSECAMVLKEAGAEEVAVLTLARAV